MGAGPVGGSWRCVDSSGPDARPGGAGDLIPDGFAWVGVSAQAVGLNQHKCPARVTAPCSAPGDQARYGTLSHPADSFSYDMFSQAGHAIRDDSAQILGGLTQKLVSGGFLIPPDGVELQNSAAMSGIGKSAGASTGAPLRSRASPGL